MTGFRGVAAGNSSGEWGLLCYKSPVAAIRQLAIVQIRGCEARDRTIRISIGSARYKYKYKTSTKPKEINSQKVNINI